MKNVANNKNQGNAFARLNPVTKLALMVVYTAPLLLSVDWVSATVSLALTLLICAVTRSSVSAAWPLLLIAPLSGISMALYGRPGGKTYLEFLLIHVTENSLDLALGITLRVLALAVPVIVLARGIDPTELGDSLAQILRLPHRFVIGAIAGVRLATLFQEDWDTLARARRVRGLGDGGKLANLATMSFGLLVVALRRGEKLSTAMEARGFGRNIAGDQPRTWARESRLRRADWLALAVVIPLAALPVLAAVATGEWRFLGL